MGGLGGLLAPLLTQATRSVGDLEGAKKATARSGIAAALQRAQLQRQEEQQAIQQQIAERQARSSGIADRLHELQGSKLEYDLAHPAPRAPVMGSAEWLAAEEARAQIGAKYRAPTQPNYQILQTSDGILQVNPKTGETRPVVGPGGAALQKPQTPMQKKALATNITTASTINKALDGLKKHGDATGWSRGWSDLLDQNVDPEGVDTRALIANVGSQIVHDRSGAAVTVSEYPRLAPFVPSIHDNAKTVQKKLRLLYQALATETEALGGSIPALVDDTAGAVPSVHPLKSKYGLE